MSARHRVLSSTLAAVCCAGALAGSAPRAHACSPQHHIFWDSLGDVVPRAGAVDVPLDAPLFFRLNKFAARESAFPKGQAPERGAGLAAYGISLTVTDSATGQEIAGVARSLGWTGVNFAWQANTPLPPGTRVKAALRVDNLFVRPADGQGPLESSVEYTVGPRALPSMSSADALQVAMESYRAPALVKGFCGDGESMTETTTAQRLRIRPPAVTGGFAEAPYHVRTILTRDVPYDFDFNPGPPGGLPMDFRFVAAGERPEIDLRLPEDPTLSTVCVASEAEDARGKKLASAPVCLKVKPAVPAETPTVTGCNLGSGEPLSPLLLIVAFSSWAAFLILRRAHRQ